MVTIKAQHRWNNTFYQISAGKKYRFQATGTWIDLSTPASATGYEDLQLKPFEWMRRFPQAKWFSLIGSIEKNKNTFFDIGRLIEENGIFTATTSGNLECFANDVWFMYWNNKGAIELKVMELEE